MSKQISEALAELNSGSEIKPIKCFDDLPQGAHEIKSIRFTKTIHGRKVMVELSDCVMFLPNRFAKIGEARVVELNEFASGTGTLYMNYNGKVGEKKTGTVLLDFTEVAENAVFEE